MTTFNGLYYPSFFSLLFSSDRQLTTQFWSHYWFPLSWKVTRWLHCDVTWALVKKQLTWWLRSGVFKQCGDHMRTTIGFHCKNTWWFITKQQSRSLYSTVTKWLSIESKNEMNKIYHIFVLGSDCETFDRLTTVKTHRLSLLLR